MTRGLAGNTAINFSANVAAALATAVAVLVVIRVLDVDQWGLCAALLGIGQFLGGLLSFGGPTRTIRNLSRVAPLVSRGAGCRWTAARLTVGLIIAALGLVIWGFIPSVGAVTALAGGVFVGLGETSVLIAHRRYPAAALVLISDKLVVLTSISVMASAGWVDAFTLPVTTALGGIAGGVVALLLQTFRGPLLKPFFGWRDVREQWVGSRYFGAASVAPSALLLDVALVSSVIGASAAGTYAVGSRLVAPLGVAATTVVQVALPVLTNTTPGAIRLTSRHLMLAAAAVVGIVAATFAIPFAVVWVLGPQYAGSELVIGLFVLNAAVVLVTRTLVTALQAWSYERLAAYLVAAQVVLALLGVAGGALLLGATGAAGAFLASNIALAITLLVVVTRMRRDERRGGVAPNYAASTL